MQKETWALVLWCSRMQMQDLPVRWLQGKHESVFDKGGLWRYRGPVCTQPMQIGPCKAAVNRFYYDPNKNKCKEFSWGGCQPNGNNFQNKKVCNKVCRGFVCSLTVTVGLCEAATKRYYYNVKTGKCQKFLWCGCDSNGNNFNSLKACKRNCMNYT